MKIEYTQDQKVNYDNGTIKGVGKIVGMVRNPLSVVGRSYIIEPEVSIKNDTYPYSHFVCFDIHLEVYKNPTKKENWDVEKRRDNPHHHNNRLD